MPWTEYTPMSSRIEFVRLASSEGANVAELCRRFGISRKTAYKWLARGRDLDPAGLSDRSRRPHRSPARTAVDVESAVLGVRQKHPAWGGRKIRAVLQRQGIESPAASTITTILRRHELVPAEESLKHRPFVRFEHAAPNDLWQMDFKGHFALSSGARCHPLTVLDDHSRFSLALRGCGNERGNTVRSELRGVFQRYGLPRAMLMDNGAPWGSDHEHPYTPLVVWFLRLGIRVTHGRPYHPQTQGKDERFHRTLKTEVLRERCFQSLSECQQRFDAWRDVYNLERPHEALDMQPPSTRYQASPRAYPDVLPLIEYSPGDHVRRVQLDGEISFRGQVYRVAKAFRGEPVAMRPTAEDGVWDVYYCWQRVAQLDQRTGECGRPPAGALPAYALSDGCATAGKAPAGK